MTDPYLRLPTPDAPSEKRYAMPDPDHLDRDAFSEWRLRILRGDYSQERSMILHVICMADAYDHFVTHPAGTEMMVRKLRETRRALACRKGVA